MSHLTVKTLEGVSIFVGITLSHTLSRVLSDFPWTEGRQNGPGIQENSQQERRHRGHRGHQWDLQWRNSTFNLWLVTLTPKAGNDQVWLTSNRDNVHDGSVIFDFIVFQSRSALPLQTTSTLLWKRIQTVQTSCPSTPRLRLYSKQWKMAFWFGECLQDESDRNTNAFTLFDFPKLHVDNVCIFCPFVLVLVYFTSISVSCVFAVNSSTSLYLTPSMREPSIRRS